MCVTNTTINASIGFLRQTKLDLFPEKKKKKKKTPLSFLTFYRNMTKDNHETVIIQHANIVTENYPA